jgi:hypothetical protein
LCEQCRFKIARMWRTDTDLVGNSNLTLRDPLYRFEQCVTTDWRHRPDKTLSGTSLLREQAQHSVLFSTLPGYAQAQRLPHKS